HSIHRYETVCSALDSESGQSPSRGLSQWAKAGNAEVGADPVHRKVIRVGALAIDAELALIVESRLHHHHAWRQHDQCLKGAAVQWQVIRKRAVDNRAHGPFGCVHVCGIRRNRNSLRSRTDIELKILFEIVLNIDGDSGQAGELESALFDFDPVMAGPHSREGIETAVSSCNLALDAAVYINQAN